MPKSYQSVISDIQTKALILSLTISLQNFWRKLLVLEAWWQSRCILNFSLCFLLPWDSWTANAAPIRGGYWTKNIPFCYIPEMTHTDSNQKNDNVAGYYMIHMKHQFMAAFSIFCFWCNKVILVLLVTLWNYLRFWQQDSRPRNTLLINWLIN